MSGHIFILHNDQLIEMTEQPYDSEDLLQSLLADYPDLLAGDQIDQTHPRRWLLISREMDVPDVEDGNGRWALDHLFLDQDAIPTLVEVKRSTDTRIRREVVGQMLDYASNAVVYWQIEKIRTLFEEKCRQKGKDPSSELINSLYVTDADVFWQNVKTNLLAGKVRLVFVADVIPPELQRIVEFLNKQMTSAEVLALEIKQFAGEGLKTLVPKIIGQTAEAQQAKSGSRSSRTWDVTSFFADLESHTSPLEVTIARKILDWGEARNLYIWWGRGSKDGSFFPIFQHNGSRYHMLSVWTYGRIEIQFQHMKYPFDTEQSRFELLNRINAIPGLNLAEDGLSRRPTFPLSLLNTDEKLYQFLEIWDWFMEAAKSYGI